jgi:rubrerythrin
LIFQSLEVVGITQTGKEGGAMLEETRETVAEHLKELFEEEAWEVAAGLARAARAREDGYPEVAALMEEIARGEARHLSLVTRILYPERIERDVHTNLQAMLEGDRGAAEREKLMAEKARQAGMEREAVLFEALARDEVEHVAKVEAALKHLNPQTEGERDLR